MTKLSVKPWLVRSVGLLLIGFALWFLGRELSNNWSSIGDWRPSNAVLLALGGLSLFYGSSLFLLAESWHRIIGAFGDEPRRRTYLSLTSTQIARYLPGNVAHILGRAIWLRNGPLTGRELTRATAIEIAVTPTGAVLALACLVPFVVSKNHLPPTVAIYTLVILVALSVLLLLKNKPTISTRLQGWITRLAAPVLLSSVFMLFLGAIFSAILNLVGEFPAALAMASAIVAWIAGYITPGVPGGIGIREATLVFLLNSGHSDENVILAAVLFRIVTTIGEVCCFLAGWIIFRRNVHPR